MQQHTITVLVDNKPGVLSRVSGLFSRRGYNIESLAVSITENPEVSRMTLVVNGDEQEVEQITKQLHKLIDVSKVQDYINIPMLRAYVLSRRPQAGRSATRPDPEPVAGARTLPRAFRAHRRSGQDVLSCRSFRSRGNRHGRRIDG